MYEPVFQTIPDDWRERWRLIRKLVARVHGVKMPEVGRAIRLPAKLKSQLAGKRLPPSVMEWMAFGKELAKCLEAAGDSIHPYSYQVTDFPDFESIAINEYYGNIRWAVAYSDFGQDDPPVAGYAFVEKQNGFVPRKSYGKAPITEFALHCVLMHTPWFHGWSNYTHRSVELKSAKGLLEELRRTKGAQVSDPFGSVTMIEGYGWMAYVVDGYCHFGRQKFVRLYSNAESRVRDIPQPIRKLFGLKRSSQLH